MGILLDGDESPTEFPAGTIVVPVAIANERVIARSLAASIKTGMTPRLRMSDALKGKNATKSTDGGFSSSSSSKPSKESAGAQRGFGGNNLETVAEHDTTNINAGTPIAGGGRSPNFGTPLMSDQEGTYMDVNFTPRLETDTPMGTGLPPTPRWETTTHGAVTANVTPRLSMVEENGSSANDTEKSLKTANDGLGSAKDDGNVGSAAEEKNVGPAASSAASGTGDDNEIEDQYRKSLVNKFEKTKETGDQNTDATVEAAAKKLGSVEAFKSCESLESCEEGNSKENSAQDDTTKVDHVVVEVGNSPEKKDVSLKSSKEFAEAVKEDQKNAAKDSVDKSAMDEC